jgi:hypothetical protein
MPWQPFFIWAHEGIGRWVESLRNPRIEYEINDGWKHKIVIDGRRAATWYTQRDGQWLLVSLWNSTQDEIRTLRDSLSDPTTVKPKKGGVSFRVYDANDLASFQKILQARTNLDSSRVLGEPTPF